LAGRTTYLSTSKVGRAVRRYRGRDLLEWWRDMGFLEVRVEELEDPAMKSATQPQVSGTDGGHTLSLQQLSRDGCILLGRLSDVDGSAFVLAPDLRDNMRFADEMSERFKKGMDDYIERSGIEAPPPEDDPAESPVNDVPTAGTIRLDSKEARISTVIWCTGFEADFGWIRVPVFDSRGAPRHERGVSSCDGLYFVGFPWLAKRKSGIIYGVGEDARCVVDHLVISRS
jgi:putative flavoprotein involved in K+ transport